MAKATQTKSVKINVTLKLTGVEAYYLRSILGHIGGNPKGPRGVIGGIYDTLLNLGGSFNHLNLPYPKIVGTLYIEKE